MGPKHFFMAAHDTPQLIDILSKWPNALIVELVDYVKFQKLAAFLKNGLVESTEAANSKITFSMENIFCRKLKYNFYIDQKTFKAYYEFLTGKELSSL